MLAVENDCSSTVWFGRRKAVCAKKVDLRLGLGSVRIKQRSEFRQRQSLLQSHLLVGRKSKILLYLHRDITVRDIYEGKAYSDESVT